MAAVAALKRAPLLDPAEFRIPTLADDAEFARASAELEALRKRMVLADDRRARAVARKRRSTATNKKNGSILQQLLAG